MCPMGWLPNEPQHPAQHGPRGGIPCVGASSLPGVQASHTGPYLGRAASGKPLAVNGIDFWCRDGDKFTENWVFLDMVHLFGQMGIDLMAKVHDPEKK